MNHSNYSNSKQSGQVLLIIVMLLATVLTILMTASLSATTQTQLTKDQEESIKVRAAAESALDLALSEPINTPRKKFSEYDSLAKLFTSINLNDSYVQVTGSTGTSFVSPVIEKDTQYTFYLADYTDGIFGTPYPSNGNLKINYGNTSTNDCNNLAIEITILSGTSGNYVTNRYIADTGNNLVSDSDDLGQSLGVARSVGDTSSSTNFYCQAVLPSPMPDNLKLLFVRPLLGDTRFGFESNAVSLRSQGKIVKAVAKSNSGVTKIVQLFQSYPQLPANIFVTSF